MSYPELGIKKWKSQRWCIRSLTQRYQGNNHKECQPRNQAIHKCCHHSCFGPKFLPCKNITTIPFTKTAYLLSTLSLVKPSKFLKESFEHQNQDIFLDFYSNPQELHYITRFFLYKNQEPVNFGRASSLFISSRFLGFNML